MTVIKWMLILVFTMVAAMFIAIAASGSFPSLTVIAVVGLLYLGFVFLIVPLGRPDNTASLIMRFHCLLALAIAMFATFVAMGGTCLASMDYPFFSGQGLYQLVMGLCNSGYRYAAAVILYGLCFYLLLAGYKKTRRVVTQPTAT